MRALLALGRPKSILRIGTTLYLMGQASDSREIINIDESGVYLRMPGGTVQMWFWGGRDKKEHFLGAYSLVPYGPRLLALIKVEDLC